MSKRAMVNKEIYSYAFSLPLFPPFVEAPCKLHYADQCRFRRIEGD
jgi:hypothetical protein